MLPAERAYNPPPIVIKNPLNEEKKLLALNIPLKS